MKPVNKFAPMLAAAAAQEAGKVVQAPMKAASDIFDHAVAIGAGKQQQQPERSETQYSKPKEEEKKPTVPVDPAANAVAAATPVVAQNKQLENEQIKAAAPDPNKIKPSNASAVTEGFTTTNTAYQ